MFLWIAECSFDNPAEIFMPKVWQFFVENPKKLQQMSFFKKIIFSEYFLDT